MSNFSAQKLEDILLQKGLIDKATYDKLNLEHLKTGTPVKDLIKKDNLVDANILLQTHAETIGIPFADGDMLHGQAEAIALIPEAVARKNNIFPFKATTDGLSIAMQDPEDLELIQYLERLTKRRLTIYISTPELILKAIDKEYGKGISKDVSEAIEQAAANTTQKMKETLQNIDQADEIIKVSPVAQIVSVILEYAIKSGASDIHIEPFEDRTRIRYRIDGVLADRFPLPSTIHNSITARIKILANMPIDEKRKPLDGKFKVEIGNRRTDMRVSTIPTVFGEKVVIRLLKNDQEKLTLDKLGVWGQGLNDFNKALEQTTGILLVTGPTGSGKTVTLATSLDKLNSVRVNIITLEDPVEISMPGVNQVQINPAAGLTFAAGLRSILRQDPNIIMVGEVRDLETARLAIQAALTGHLVLATLHTNSAAASIPRLIDMGIEPFLLSSTINLALAQRLARRLCKDCKQEYEPSDAVKEDVKKILGEKLLQIGLGESQIGMKEKHETHDHPENQTTPPIDKKIKLYKPVGCDKCNNTGFKGRIGLYEVLKVNTEIKRLAEDNAPADKLHKQAIESGMITLVQDGYIKALWGITTIEEVLSVADE
jgi:type IV pilus assembly protein PilB